MSGGRPTLYTQEVADRICDMIANDQPLSEILVEGMPSHSTVMRWLRENVEFRNNYADAREAQAEWQSDYIRGLGGKAEMGLIPPDAARVAMDAYKWSAGKRNPKKYGDKIQQEVTGKDGGPIQYETLSTDELLAKAKAMLAQYPDLLKG